MMTASRMALGAGFALLLAAASVNADPLFEERLARLERLVNERGLSDLLLQIQQLQQEVRELRGQVEQQQYRLEQGGAPGPRFDEAAPGPSWDSPPERSSEEAINEFERRFARDPDAAPVARMPPAASLDAVPDAASSASAPLVPLLPALPPAETMAGGERELYQRAFDHLKERDYATATSAFGELLERYPRGQFADNARYWLGEIGYVTRRYADALREFERLISDDPGSGKVPAAMLKIGYIHAEQRDWEQARAALRRVIANYPNTPEGRLAGIRLDEIERQAPP